MYVHILFFYLYIFFVVMPIMIITKIILRKEKRRRKTYKSITTVGDLAQKQAQRTTDTLYKNVV